MGPLNPDSLVPEPRRIAGTGCGVVSLRCAAFFPVRFHTGCSAVFLTFSLLFFHPGRRIQARPGSDALAYGTRHTHTHASQSRANIPLERRPPSQKNRASALPGTCARDLFISPPKFDSLPIWNSLTYATQRLVLQEQPPETLHSAFVSFLLPYLCHVPASLQPDAPEAHLT